MTKLTREKFSSVWPAIEPNAAEALNLAMRSELMTSIERTVGKWGLPQAEAAARLGITRPRLNDLLRGKISKFSLDALAALATKAGLKVRLSVKKVAVRKAPSIVDGIKGSFLLQVK